MLQLSNEVMAGFALGIFWIHTLLIAAAAGQDLVALLRLRGRLQPLVRGRVRRGAGEGGVFARNVVQQIGRSKGDGRIHFSDAGYRSELLGGVIELDDGRTLELAASTQIPVWPDLARRAAAARPDSPQRIAEVEPQAKRGKGWSREVVSELREGDVVWLDQRGDAPTVLAAIPPRAWLARRAWLVAGFVIAELAVAVGCTVLALWPPVFGPISMLGAAASLGFFLGVQPLGVSLNEAVRTPDRAYLRGRW